QLLPAVARIPLLAWLWRDSGVTAAVVSNRGTAGIGTGQTATKTATEAMNTHPSYTLASRPQTGRYLRARAVLLRGTFAAAIFLTDVAFIVAMACLTGIAYHLAAYGKSGNITLFLQVGVLAARIFAPSHQHRAPHQRHHV